MRRSTANIIMGLAVLLILSCNTTPDNQDPPPLPNIDFRQAMRNFVIDLSKTLDINPSKGIIKNKKTIVVKVVPIPSANWVVEASHKSSEIKV